MDYNENEEKQFKVCLDVHQFKPSELSVKVMGKTVVVEGKHEGNENEADHVSRHFVRSYPLPQIYSCDEVTSTLSSSGILTISVTSSQLNDNKGSNESISSGSEI